MSALLAAAYRAARTLRHYPAAARLYVEHAEFRETMNAVGFDVPYLTFADALSIVVRAAEEPT